jgi:hypothetical protein
MAGSQEAMRQAVFASIKTYYNPVRLNSTNNFLSPVEYEDRFFYPSLLYLSILDGWDHVELLSGTHTKFFEEHWVKYAG